MEENTPGQTSEPIVIQNEPKKKKPVLTIIFAILALAGIGFGVYGMFFNKLTEKECIESEVANQDKPSQEAKNDYTIYYDLIKKYFIRSHYNNTDSYENGDFNDVNYMATVLYDNHIITVEDTVGGNSGVIYNVEGFKNGLKDFFNYEDEINEFTINCVGTFKLIPQDGSVSAQYKTEHYGGCGGAGGSVPLLTITDVTEKDDSLSIDVVYSRLRNAPMYYSVLGKTFEFTDMTEDSKTKADAEQYFDSHLDEASKYKLTFKKTNKHYYLESGEKLN